MKGLIINKGLVHPTTLQQRIVRETAKKAKGWSFGTLTPEKAVERGLGGIDLVILFYHIKEDCNPFISALTDYAENGGYLFAIHGASASFKTSGAYEALIGGKFIGHPPVLKYKVEPTEEGKALFPGWESAEVRDEQYFHSYDEKNRVLLSSFSSERENEPVYWIKEAGKGRVYYLALGHTTQAIKSPLFSGIILDTLDHAKASLDG